MSSYYFLFLFFMIVLVSLYDLKYREVPNWISIPLIFIGLITGFPGNPTIWIGSIFIFQAWRLGIIGGGGREAVGGVAVVLILFYRRKNPPCNVYLADDHRAGADPRTSAYQEKSRDRHQSPWRVASRHFHGLYSLFQFGKWVVIQILWTLKDHVYRFIRSRQG